MKIHTRDFIEWRYKENSSTPEYFVNNKPITLAQGDHTDYIQHVVTTDPALDLNHGPVFVMCMGVFQADDVTHRSIDEVRRSLKSGRMPLLEKFLDQLARGKDMEPVLKHLSEGLERMCRGYFRMADEVFGDPAMHMVPPKTYLVSYDSIEERMKALYDFPHTNQNTFITHESTEFVRRAIAPYLGEYVVHAGNSNNEKIIEIRKRNTTQNIVKYLENIVFMGNSTGANFIIEVENVLRDTLQRSHFPDGDIKTIMRSIRAVGLGQLADYESLSGPRFTSIFFEGINDLVAETLNPKKLRVPQHEINRYCRPAQQDLLRDIAQEHYDAMRSMVDDRSTDLDAKTLPLTSKQIFIPRLQPADNRMLVLSALPMDRKKWAMRSFLKPQRFANSGTVNADLETERQFHEILQAVSEDKNGHHIAYYFTQGYPPFYLVALVHRILKNMIVFPFLSAGEKNQFNASDFLIKNLMRRNVGEDSNFVGKQDMLQYAVRDGLECARRESSKSEVHR